MRQLDAEIVREFVEPGRTATSIDKRPVFQELISWVKEQRDIDYVVVYHFNRAFRNSTDAALTKRDLNRVGTRLISTILDLGEGPESSMVETILSAVDEYQSTRSGADISYKMGAKARNGGTLGRARLGYLNVRDTTQGRNIGTVVLDEERAPLVVAAFELYATGDYTIESLQEEMADRGLRTRPGRFPAGPVSTSKLAAMLRDPYYIGYVTYKGEQFPGRHPQLVTRALFERVQTVLDHRSGSGQRQRRHHHYLKGLLWCGSCHDNGIESRMLMQWSKGNGGLYLYFFCTEKKTHSCESRYLEGDAVEAAAIDACATLNLEPELAQRLRTVMEDALTERERAARMLNKQLRTELARLETKESNLIDLASEGNLAVTKIRQKLGLIRQQRDKLLERLATSDDQLDVGVRVIERGLDLLEDPQDRYKRMAPEQRRMMNLTFFEKLYVYDDGSARVSLRVPFDALLGAQAVVRRGRGYARSKAVRKVEDVLEMQQDQVVSDLAAIFCGHGSTKAVMVEVMGFEPTASTLRT